MFTIVFKISGKIIDLPNPAKCTPFFAEMIRPKVYNSCKIILIPGGGNKVNKLRNKYREDIKRISKKEKSITARSNEEIAELEAYYHRKAIEIMDDNASILYDALVGLKCIPKDLLILTDSAGMINRDRAGIFCFQPSSFLRDNPGLQYSWSVTSDSISVFIAGKLGLSHVFLIKDIDFLLLGGNNRVNSMSFEDLRREMKVSGYSDGLDRHLGKGTMFPVDPEFPNICILYNLTASILNGFNQKMMSNLFKNYCENKKGNENKSLLPEFYRDNGGIFLY